MSKLKVMTLVGTRPELIRLSRIIVKLDTFCDHTLVHTGQNYDYELNEIFFKDLEIRAPDRFLNAAGANPAETIGNVIIGAHKAMEEKKPEAVLLLGDTNSCLAAIAAKRLQIPIFHMEAGNRCFDFRVPEEINRRLVDHIADINLTYSEIAREYLLREGLPPDQVIKTGSPMREVINHYLSGIERSHALQSLGLTPSSYFLVSIHREENVDNLSSLEKILTALNSIAELYNEPIIVSTHPRTAKRLKELQFKTDPRIRFLKPFGFLDYLKLQTSARCVLSDSGTITEESSILNFPALNLRQVHERPEGFEEGSVMFVGMDLDRILQGLAILDKQPRGSERALRIVNDYAVENVSEKVLRIIQSYTNYINQKVWRK